MHAYVHKHISTNSLQRKIKIKKEILHYVDSVGSSLKPLLTAKRLTQSKLKQNASDSNHTQNSSIQSALTLQ